MSELEKACDNIKTDLVKLTYLVDAIKLRKDVKLIKDAKQLRKDIKLQLKTIKSIFEDQETGLFDAITKEDIESDA